MTTGTFMQVDREVSPPIMARDFKDPTSIAPVPHEQPQCGAKQSQCGTEPAPQEVSYTVRRLTPTECARLQGFPDDWCHDLGTADPTDEEIAFWTDVLEDSHGVRKMKAAFIHITVCHRCVCTRQGLPGLNWVDNGALVCHITLCKKVSVMLL